MTASQRTAATDAYILMMFARETAHIRAVLPPKGTPPTADIQADIRNIGTPIVRKLQQNGHSLADAIALMRAVLYMPVQS